MRPDIDILMPDINILRLDIDILRLYIDIAQWGQRDNNGGNQHYVKGVHSNDLVYHTFSFNALNNHKPLFHSNGISVREGDRSAARNHRSPEKVNWEAQEGPPRWVGPKSGHSSFTTSSFHVYEKQPPASKSSQFLPYDHRSAHRTGWVPPPRERSKGVDGIWAAGYRKWD